MDLIQGGYSKIEVASDDTFADAIIILQLLKAGTFIKIKTDETELADGKKYTELKRLDFGIRSADIEQSEGSAYDFVKSAEIARTTLAFRFRTIGNISAIVKNVLVIVVREINEIGKFCAIQISGAVIGLTEADIITYRSAFYDLKIDSIHRLKIDSTHVLRIS